MIGIAAGAKGELNLAKLMYKRGRVMASTMRARPLEEKVAASRAFVAEVVPAIEAGHVHPVIDRRFSLADIAEAHRYLETNANVGKVLIDVA